MHPGLTRTLRWVGLLEAGPSRGASLAHASVARAAGCPDHRRQKCGTSSLHNYLTQHRAVIAPLRKEVHYFDVNFHRGEAWYRAHFGRDRATRAQPRQQPYYLFHPTVPRRAGELLPQARLIVLLRDPVRRAYSHYWHERDKGRENAVVRGCDRGRTRPDRSGGGATGAWRDRAQRRAPVLQLPLARLLRGAARALARCLSARTDAGVAVRGPRQGCAGRAQPNAGVPATSGHDECEARSAQHAQVSRR